MTETTRAAGLRRVGPGPCATFNIKPPEPFSLSKLQEWDKWKRRFERFHLASNLNANSEENQINTLKYCMGDEADNILCKLLRVKKNVISVLSSTCGN